MKSAKTKTSQGTPLSGKRSTFYKKEAVAGYLFTLPAILGLLLLIIGPMIASLFVSFTNWTVLNDLQWIGLENYRNILFDDLFFKKSVMVTFYYSMASVFFTMISSIILGLLMNLNMRNIAFFRTVFYLPTIVPAVAASMLWLWLFNPDFGLFNSILMNMGLPKLMWIYDESTAVPSLVLMRMWESGSMALIILAGLKDVPKHLYEAVDIDGGNWWHKFWFVSIPMITPVIFFNLIMGLIRAFQAFTEAYVMTEGGPNNATLFYVYLIYREAFMQNNFGYASALSWILFLIIALFTAVIFKSSKSWVHYGGGR